MKKLGDKNFSKYNAFIIGFYDPWNKIWENLNFKKIIVIFAGADITHLEEMSKTERQKFFSKLKSKRAIFATEGEVIREKIQDIFGIDTRVVYLPARFDFLDSVPLPDSGYHIGCYVPSKLSRYYNLDLVLEIAEKMPDITFHIYGIDGVSDSYRKDNIVPYKDTVTDMPKFIGNMNCGLRITTHDTYSMSAIEYNMAGRWFINNHDMPCCDKISHEPTSDEIISVIHSIRNRSGQNIDGRDYYRQRHIKEVFIKRVNDIYSW